MDKYVVNLCYPPDYLQPESEGYGSKHGYVYKASKVDTLIAEMQEKEKQDMEIYKKIFNHNVRLIKENAALLEVLEAADESDELDKITVRLTKAIKKAREVINGNSNDK